MTNCVQFSKIWAQHTALAHNLSFLLCFRCNLEHHGCWKLTRREIDVKIKSKYNGGLTLIICYWLSKLSTLLWTIFDILPNQIMWRTYGQTDQEMLTLLKKSVWTLLLESFGMSPLVLFLDGIVLRIQCSNSDKGKVFFLYKNLIIVFFLICFLWVEQTSLLKPIASWKWGRREATRKQKQWWCGGRPSARTQCSGLVFTFWLVCLLVKIKPINSA